MPNRKPTEALSICHLNLNSITELHLWKVYVTVHNFDLICLSETYLAFSNVFDNDNLDISDYNLICSDNPSINKCGGVCIYSSFKSLIYKSFGQMYKLWVKVVDKPGRFVSLYRSPSKTQDNFCHFHKTLNLPLKIVRK